MAQVDGSQLMAEGLKEEGVDTIFYIMGGPNYPFIHACRTTWDTVD